MNGRDCRLYGVGAWGLAQRCLDKLQSFPNLGLRPQAALLILQQDRIAAFIGARVAACVVQQH